MRRRSRAGPLPEAFRTAIEPDRRPSEAVGGIRPSAATALLASRRAERYVARERPDPWRTAQSHRAIPQSPRHAARSAGHVGPGWAPIRHAVTALLAPKPVPILHVISRQAAESPAHRSRHPR